MNHQPATITWRTRRACADLNTEHQLVIDFDLSQRTQIPSRRRPPSGRTATAFTALRAACSGCPVRAECDEDRKAATFPVFGMWAGLTSTERHEISHRREQARRRLPAGQLAELLSSGRG